MGLVIPATIYNTVPETRPFVRPQDPGPFMPTPRRVARVLRRGRAVINGNELTAEEITLQKYQYDKQLVMYNEV